MPFAAHGALVFACLLRKAFHVAIETEPQRAVRPDLGRAAHAAHHRPGFAGACSSQIGARAPRCAPMGGATRGVGTRTQGFETAVSARELERDGGGLDVSLRTRRWRPRRENSFCDVVELGRRGTTHGAGTRTQGFETRGAGTRTQGFEA